MRLGPVLVVIGSIFGSLATALFLYFITASASYPTPSSITINDVSSIQQPIVSNEKDSTEKDSLVGCEVSPRFPESVRKWCNQITQQAKSKNLDPDLVAAVIWQESGGNPTAYSKSGAVGLMQVMPRDGLAASFNCVNGPCFAQRPSIQELQDPDFNISYGTGMLSGLTAKQGNIRDALKSYGPMNVGYYYADKILNIYENHRD